MIRDGYELDPQQTDAAVRWLELNAPEDAVGIRAIVPSFKLAEHGGDRKSEEAQNQVGPTKLIGNTAAYYLARLERDGQASRSPFGAASHRIGRTPQAHSRQRHARFFSV